MTREVLTAAKFPQLHQQQEERNGKVFIDSWAV